MGIKKWDSIGVKIPLVFDQAQLSMTNHRKNCVALYKMHQTLCDIPRQTKDSTVRLTGERLFTTIFLDMINRVLVIRKGTAPADRLVLFIGSYVRYLIEKPMKAQAGPSSKTDPIARQSFDLDVDSTAETRFISHLLSYLLEGFQAKDKTIRFRAVNIVSELVSHLGELDEDLYKILRSELLERVRDKEPLIRAHALAALSKLLNGEDFEASDGENLGILDAMLESMCYDPSSEVRRFALLNTPLTPITLPRILTRTRDVDTSVRTFLYSAVLLPSKLPSTTSAARHRSPCPNRLAHPRHLTIAQREKIASDGLRDREDRVRAAAGKMLGAWFDQVVGEIKVKEENPMAALIEFLKLFDVVGDGGTFIAADALNSIFVTRPRVLDSILFSDEFWNHLSPESILLARVYHEHVAARNDSERRLEMSSLPVVTAFAFYTQEACNSIFDVMENIEDLRLTSTDVDQQAEIEGLNVTLIDRIFVLSEVLKVATKLDYTDEIGRKKMSQVTRSILAHELFPEQLIDPCLEVLKQTTPNEKDIIRIVVEIIYELRDSAYQECFEDEVSIINSSIGNSVFSSGRVRGPLSAMASEECERLDEIDTRSLSLCIAVLKRVNGNFDENLVSEGMLSDLILPAVKQRELIVRERGILALGLCCLIAKKVAMSSFQLFLNQVQSAPEGLKLKVLQVVFDILMTYEDLLCRSQDIAERIIAFLLQTLEVEESKAVQALLCVGISKLMLNGLITDERVLASLVLAYVSPISSDNQELRQCLSYFLPVYCYTSILNQDRMISIFLTAYDLVAAVHEEMEEEDMISPVQFAILFVDWTNPQKTAVQSGVERKDVHIDFAIDLLTALYDQRRNENDKEIFSHLLAKLFFPDDVDNVSLFCISTLLDNVDEYIPEDGLTSRKSLQQFRSLFTKRFTKRLKDLDQDELKKSDKFRTVCEIIGIEITEDDVHGEDQESEEDRIEDRAGMGRGLRSPVPSPSPRLSLSHHRKTDRGKGSSAQLDLDASSEEFGSESRCSQAELSLRPTAIAATGRHNLPKNEKRARSPDNTGISSPVHKRKDDRKTLRRRGQVETFSGFKKRSKQMAHRCEADSSEDE